MGENCDGNFVHHSGHAHLFAFIEKNRIINTNSFNDIKMEKNLSKNLKFQLLLLLIFLSVTMGGQNLRETPKIEILTSEFIFDKAPFRECHASTLLETEKNKILSAWFGGTREGNKDVCIYLAEKDKQGKWSAPRKVADGIVNDTLQYPCWNPVLYKKANGNIVLFYKIGPNPREWWGMYKISSDNGKSWSNPVKLPDGILGPIKNKPIGLDDGTILCPTSFETSEKWNVYLETTDQDFKNWNKTAIDNRQFNAIQPTILIHKNNHLQMLCRTRERVIATTRSFDSGKSWTPLQPTSLPNNNSGIDAVTCANGAHLIVYNPITEGRNKLALAYSPDGETWTKIFDLESESEGEFSYPAIIQSVDGTIHITYTYNRKKIRYVRLKIK
jgi:alpha-L-fucosidase